MAATDCCHIATTKKNRRYWEQKSYGWHGSCSIEWRLFDNLVASAGQGGAKEMVEMDEEGPAHFVITTQEKTGGHK